MTIKLGINLAHIKIRTNLKKIVRYNFKMAAKMATNSLKMTFLVKKNRSNLTIFSEDTENGQLE